MNVLHLSTSDIDNGGARAAYRLHQGLRSLGCNSKMLVRAKFSSSSSVISEKSPLTKLSPPLSGLPLRFYPNRDGEMFSSQWVPDVLTSRVKQYNPSIINLHWICNGFLKIETLAQFQQPMVWTLHDMWTFTGGCHYNRNCERYKETCGTCPQLHSNHSWDLSRWVWQRKAKSWQNLNLTLVATSSWMAECARSSSLFKDRRVELIPLGLDTEKYKPINQQVARELLGLPQNKQLVLFGAINATSDERKGFHLLLPALQHLSRSGWQEQLELIVFGSDQPDEPIDLGFKSHYLGRVHDDISLALIYSAADVMVVPSVQEAFGQTASEALSCGTPVAAFNATGVKDIVDHQQNGYLAKAFEIDDLAKGIAWILEDRERHHKLQHQAREKSLREFASEVQARRYLSLYEQILKE
ncbi:MAG: glycosyltransferase family 4 protein [Oscillatoriales cyanobacterium C42_A2020_001]|nr:glycosyltransferase family 4 protein [Leptolyngbyaceae cyanobacterium C42_A2020_001]